MSLNRKSEGSALTLSRLLYFLLILSLFLSSINFINRYYYCLFVAFGIFLLAPNRKFILNTSLVALLLLSFAIIIFNPTSRVGFTAILKPLVFPMCYIIGCGLFSEKALTFSEHEKKFKHITVILMLGMLAHFFLNMVTNWGIEERNTIDFWTNDVLSATGQATLASMAVGVLMAFLFSPVSWKGKVLSAILLAGIVLYNLVLAGRTLFVLMLIAFFVALIARALLLKKQIFKMLFFTILIIALLYTLYSTNIFNVKTIFESSNFYERFFTSSTSIEIGEDSRFSQKLDHIRLMPYHLFGGDKIREALGGASAHDLYLDTYSESGVFALLGVSIYVFASIRRVFRCLKSEKISFTTKMLVLCVYVIMNIQFWLEPIMKGMPFYFAIYCVVDGVLTLLISRERIETTATR